MRPNQHCMSAYFNMIYSIACFCTGTYVLVIRLKIECVIYSQGWRFVWCSTPMAIQLDWARSGFLEAHLNRELPLMGMMRTRTINRLSKFFRLLGRFHGTSFCGREHNLIFQIQNTIAIDHPWCLSAHNVFMFSNIHSNYKYHVPSNIYGRMRARI